MSVVHRRQSGADVQELPDPRLADQEPHDPAQEHPVGARMADDIGQHGRDLIAHLTVDRVIVLAAQILVICWASTHTCGPECGYVMSA
jgi:hypothetical protein